MALPAIGKQIGFTAGVFSDATHDRADFKSREAAGLGYCCQPKAFTLNLGFRVYGL